MISSARLGDKHVCPLPGHGTTLIASASGDVNINFMGSAVWVIPVGVVQSSLQAFLQFR